MFLAFWHVLSGDIVTRQITTQWDQTANEQKHFAVMSLYFSKMSDRRRKSLRCSL